MEEWMRKSVIDLGGQPPLPGEKSILEMADEMRQSDERIFSVEYGVKQNPEQSTLNQSNAKKLNVPLSVVESNPQETDWLNKSNEALKKLDESQVKALKQRALDPDFVAANHDDFDALEKVSQTASTLGTSLQTGLYGFNEVPSVLAV